ncbi:MAG: ATP-binding protein [Tissierella sp.]|uniref:ATP-binding protein n=1 Tax=Tissierella sp. TaxID=41274 RepID=UPI003F9D55D1
MEYTYKGSIYSNLDLVKNFVENILEKLDKIINDEDTIFDVRLIMNELIINGIFHGNEYIESKTVQIKIEVKEDKIMIHVKDEGTGIHYDFESYNPMDFKCRGRGLVLVEGLSDELILDENKVTAIKYLS